MHTPCVQENADDPFTNGGSGRSSAVVHQALFTSRPTYGLVGSKTGVFTAGTGDNLVVGIFCPAGAND